jgi:hypothetical protein
MVRKMKTSEADTLERKRKKSIWMREARAAVTAINSRKGHPASARGNR